MTRSGFQSSIALAVLPYEKGFAVSSSLSLATGNGIVILCHILRLPREEKIRILSAEVECLDSMMLAQFFKKAGIELGYSSSIRIETGQYCYFQLFLVFVLDIFLVQT